MPLEILIITYKELHSEKLRKTWLFYEGTSRDSKKLLSLNFVHKQGICRLGKDEEDMGPSCDLAEISTFYYHFRMGLHFSDELKVSSFNVNLCPSESLN
jgi:hypothetical protein